jgi:hypothetical protein
MNDQFADRELSIEELEAIAAGGWFSNLVHKVEHYAGEVVHYATPIVKAAFQDILQPWKHMPPGGL